MASQKLGPGLLHVEKVRVTKALTVPSMAESFPSFAEMPPVFATAFLVAAVEWACMEAISPYLEKGQVSVGTRVDIGHLAATPVGMNVEIHVELVKVASRKLLFKVRCSDDAELICEGTHERFVVDLAKLVSRVEKKVALAV